MFGSIRLDVLKKRRRRSAFISTQYDDITRRASAMLAGFTDERLNDELFKLEAIIFQCAPDLFEPDDFEPDPETAASVSVPEILFKKHRSVELDEVDDLTWPQYFALLALMYRDQIDIAESYASEADFEDEFPDERSARVAAYAVDAMAALCYAEGLAGTTVVIEEIKRSDRSERNRHAALLRHAYRRELKQQFVEFHLAHTHRSQAENARRFIETRADEFKPQKHENAMRMLLEHLRTYLKQMNDSDTTPPR